MGKRLSDEFIISYIDSIGYKFLNFVDDDHRRLKVSCEEDHKYTTSLTNIYTKGRGCKICAYKNKATRKIIDFNKLKLSLATEDYVLISIAGKKPSASILNYKCDKGHIHSTRLYDWENGVRCGKCKQVALAQILDSFTKEEYSLHTQVYVNNTTLLHYTCSHGHNNYTNWKKWQCGVRCPVCDTIFNRGENHANWKGGFSVKDYCPIWSDKGYKSDIRERDGNICQNPCCYHTTDKLAIHHIDYDKKNCHPSNLITVCNSCNLRANVYRDWHTSWYQAIMRKKFNYKY